MEQVLISFKQSTAAVVSGFFVVLVLGMHHGTMHHCQQQASHSRNSHHGVHHVSTRSSQHIVGPSGPGIRNKGPLGPYMY